MIIEKRTSSYGKQLVDIWRNKKARHTPAAGNVVANSTDRTVLLNMHLVAPMSPEYALQLAEMLTTAATAAKGGDYD